MEPLQGRVALVTGGGRGIGRAIALALARAGADVAVAARTVPEIEAVAAEIAALGRKTHFFPLDLSDRARLAVAPREVEARLGPVDVLVNNAGMHGSAPVHRLDDALWDGILAVDLTGPFVLARACLPGMYERRFGRVINIASVAGKIGLKYGAAYSAAKHGLIGLTRSLALEGARKGVTANAICPSWTETRMMEEAASGIAASTGRTRAEAREAMLRDNPLGRAALPEEVADVAVLLASNGAITGQAIHVDGGEVMA
ncbi:SDR family NAD(P)-dependent oxidoreductase [Anaeromyxobacter sp. Fw109-5]|uniref:SDR family NAD(P)-dependent oxidoreductase n=1 Tax=Anaeromyxobacter sp. (strain Fw109-5) TaxID=404589 RepID=UPI0000ED6E49|nr:SDR family NAD(P)-dependent oxidoreductase [Anaeromyxobacter sp. Fw109-5]ABS28043.1 short-chain dehydrogenase/reductase SDR [Anaeromyxobacter sp. Fw109-5]